jgi:hypothetical protein
MRESLFSLSVYSLFLPFSLSLSLSVSRSVTLLPHELCLSV